MQLSCSRHDTILDIPVLGSYKVTAIYYRHRVMNVIPLEDSSSHCPLQKLVSRNHSTDVYTPAIHPDHDSVLVGCSRVATDQDGIAGPTSCLSLSENSTQFWYLVDPETDMSTLPMGCVVVGKDIPIPYTYNKNGPNYWTHWGISIFKEKADRAINFGETTFNWYLNNITSFCQSCEKEGQHCGFSPKSGQAFCQQQGIACAAQIHTVVRTSSKLYHY
ncbi:hypothetical protein HU200_060362 [Digitaria exilis]|uniref:RING-type E3 ubiquitin transferase n=1 Tax=Digitaria exilis TaxID=1010633 RepID=A0A835DXJ3_9POAL|nr:hypothetical protein HU200_060362 [Digitaria exilis]